MTSDPKYKHETITQYLLGALPEAETERLDELSFTDDEFTDSLTAVEKDLVDSFVHGELTGGELERFKAHYLASPVRRERVAFAQAFQVLGERESAGLRAEGPANVATKRGWFAAAVGWQLTTYVCANKCLRPRRAEMRSSNASRICKRKSNRSARPIHKLNRNSRASAMNASGWNRN